MIAYGAEVPDARVGVVLDPVQNRRPGPPLTVGQPAGGDQDGLAGQPGGVAGLQDPVERGARPGPPGQCRALGELLGRGLRAPGPPAQRDEEVLGALAAVRVRGLLAVPPGHDGLEVLRAGPQEVGQHAFGDPALLSVLAHGGQPQQVGDGRGAVGRQWAAGRFLATAGHRPGRRGHADTQVRLGRGGQAQAERGGAGEVGQRRVRDHDDHERGRQGQGVGRVSQVRYARRVRADGSCRSAVRPPLR